MAMPVRAATTAVLLASLVLAAGKLGPADSTQSLAEVDAPSMWTNLMHLSTMAGAPFWGWARLLAFS